MLKGKTTSGFEYEIDENRLSNYELVEAMAEEETNPLAVVKIVNLILGNQAEKLKDHLREKDGTVPSTKIGEEIKEILEQQKSLKN